MERIAGTLQDKRLQRNTRHKKESCNCALYRNMEASHVGSHATARCADTAPGHRTSNALAVLSWQGDYLFSSSVSETPNACMWSWSTFTLSSLSLLTSRGEDADRQSNARLACSMGLGEAPSIDSLKVQTN
jgi:hypothetical protein